MIPGSVPFPEAVAAARATHGETIAEAVAWAAAFGRPVDPDVLALLHAAEDDDRCRRPGGWDRERFYGFFCNGIGNWCVLTGCPYPHEILPETLWLWLHHRAVSGRWPPGDEPLHDLLKVLLCYSDLGFDGRPMGGAKTHRIVPCECYVSRRCPREPDAPTVGDLEQETAAELGFPRRHGDGDGDGDGAGQVQTARLDDGRRRPRRAIGPPG